MQPFADRMIPITGSAIREIFKLLDMPGLISFAGGMPAKESFPAQKIAEITTKLMAEQGESVLQYGATEGWKPLRESCAALVTNKGVKATANDVLTLTGSSQGIELIAKVFLNTGDVVLVENPTFLGALQTFRTYRAVPVGVDMDESGILLDDLEAKLIQYKPKILYTIPTFQNPSGKTLPAQRRIKLLELAARYDVLVVEDDPYGELRYAGEPQPLIKSFDTEDRVLLLNSFSKTISPGLRVGFAVGAADILRKMTIAKQGMDTHTSNLSQAIVDRYLREDCYYPHIKEICGSYRLQLNAMLEAMGNCFPKKAVYTRPEGGLFVWVELPCGIDTMELMKQAVPRGVAYIPGTHFFAGGGHENTMRLNFSAANVEQIGRGVRILGELLNASL